MWFLYITLLEYFGEKYNGHICYCKDNLWYTHIEVFNESFDKICGRSHQNEQCLQSNLGLLSTLSSRKSVVDLNPLNFLLWHMKPWIYESLMDGVEDRIEDIVVAAYMD